MHPKVAKLLPVVGGAVLQVLVSHLSKTPPSPSLVISQPVVPNVTSASQGDCTCSCQVVLGVDFAVVGCVVFCVFLFSTLGFVAGRWSVPAVVPLSAGLGLSTTRTDLSPSRLRTIGGASDTESTTTELSNFDAWASERARAASSRSSNRGVVVTPATRVKAIETSKVA